MVVVFVVVIVVVVIVVVDVCCCLLFVVCCLLFVVCCLLLFVVVCLLFVVVCLLFVCCLLFVVLESQTHVKARYHAHVQARFFAHVQASVRPRKCTLGKKRESGFWTCAIGHLLLFFGCAQLIRYATCAICCGPLETKNCQKPRFSKKWSAGWLEKKMTYFRSIRSATPHLQPPANFSGGSLVGTSLSYVQDCYFQKSSLFLPSFLLWFYFLLVLVFFWPPHFLVLRKTVFDSYPHTCAIYGLPADIMEYHGAI